jgi:hypothetical protein
MKNFSKSPFYGKKNSRTAKNSGAKIDNQEVTTPLD